MCRRTTHAADPGAGGLAWPVDRRVGSPRNNGPELLDAIDLAGQAAP